MLILGREGEFTPNVFDNESVQHLEICLFLVCRPPQTARVFLAISVGRLAGRFLQGQVKETFIVEPKRYKNWGDIFTSFLAISSNFDMEAGSN